jgi:hypothetical protein
MFTIAKLVKIFQPYIEEKLSGFDTNLFKSFYSADVIECDLRATLGLTKKANLKKKVDIGVEGSLKPE